VGSKDAAGRPATQTRIVALDSLRGIFALAVVALHTPIAHHALNAPLVRNAWIFVDYFFVLSGFVIAFAYHDRLSRPDLVGRFFILRFGRLWPLHLAMTLALLLLLAVKSGLMAMHFGPQDATKLTPDTALFAVQDLLFLNVFLNHADMRLNFPAWSINAEFWAYIVFAGTCLLASMASRKGKTVMLLLTAIILGVTGLILAEVIHLPFGAAWGWGGVRAIFAFLLGYLAFRIWEPLRDRGVQTGIVIELLVVAAVIAMIWHIDTVPALWAVSTVLFAISILVFALSQGMLSKLLSTQPGRLMGQRSYSIYLIHIVILSYIGLFIRALERLLHVQINAPIKIAGEVRNVVDFGSVWLNDIAMVGLLLLVCWAAGLTYAYIEMPGQRIARRLADRLFGK
jgi:peptidoglycan/LPS O-acetylase OafA/YrhL